MLNVAPLDPPPGNRTRGLVVARGTHSDALDNTRRNPSYLHLRGLTASHIARQPLAYRQVAMRCARAGSCEQDGALKGENATCNTQGQGAAKRLSECVPVAHEVCPQQDPGETMVS